VRVHHSLIRLAAGTTATATVCGCTRTSALIEAFRRTFGTTPGRHRQAASVGGGADLPAG
jgi:AraC-like DNA-binding protein